MLDDLLDDLPGWFVRYNFCRKNRRNNFCRKNRRIGGKRPYEAVLAWHKKAPSLFIQEPAAFIQEPAALLALRNGCSHSSVLTW